MNAYLRRMRTLSSNIVWYRATRDFVLKRLRRLGIDDSIILALTNSSRCTYPVNISSGCTASVRTKHDTLWIRLPYHNVWHSEINRSLANLCEDPQYAEVLNYALGCRLDIKAAWMLSSPTLVNTVSKI